METPKIVVLVVKLYAVLEAQKWRYAVRKNKIRRYALHNGGRGCRPQIRLLMSQLFVMSILHYEYLKACTHVVVNAIVSIT